ncbi:MAG: divalent metal cation transporter [Candidatus Magasanikbacteria bacterium]|nr:divalent metal cation transporter [Candidatus Magasanikbacteria bacterium]
MAALTWHKLLLIFRVIGPGLITGFADNDAGGVATYSMSAATYGHLVLITLIPITIVLMVSQEIGARITIATGKGLSDLIRERFGVRTAFIMFALLFIVNFGVILQNVSGLKSALELFHLDYRFFLPLIVLVLFLILLKGSFQKIQRFFFVLMFFYLTYLFSAIYAHPDWPAVLRAVVVPERSFDLAFVFTAIAVLGTTVTAWGQFFISSYVKDKRISKRHLRYERWEIVSAALLSNLFTFFMMVAVTETLYRNGVPIEGAADAAKAIAPFAGQLASVLFGVGLLIAALLGCTIVPLATSYAFVEFFGSEGSLDIVRFKQGKLFYTFFLVQIVGGTALVMLSRVSLFRITLYADFLNGLLLPFLFYFLYKLGNDEKIMEENKNTPWQNFLLLACALAVCVGVLVSVGVNIRQLF